MLDYEFTEARIFNAFANVLLMPKLIPDNRLADAGFNLKKVVRYDGFKEEIYLADFHPESNFRRSLDIDEKAILVVMRPPATEGNYHDEKSETLFRKCLEHFSSNADVRCLLLKRSASDAKLLTPMLRERSNISFLRQAVDGLQLIWNADIVVSGGGTMNRESALLGTPTYSIFTGRRPYLDEYLSEQGKLRFVQGIDEVEKIPVVKRTVPREYQPVNTQLAATLTDLLIELSRKRF